MTDFSQGQGKYKMNLGYLVVTENNPKTNGGMSEGHNTRLKRLILAKVECQKD